MKQNTRNILKKLAEAWAFKIGNLYSNFAISQIYCTGNKYTHKKDSGLNEEEHHVRGIFSKYACNKGRKHDNANHTYQEKNINNDNRKKIIPSVAKVFLK